MDALIRKTRQGRPCLLETHRSNFIGNPFVTRDAINETERLVSEAVSRYPALRFLSTRELGQAFAQNDQDWLENRIPQRVLSWLERVREISGFRRLSRVTGLAGVARLVQTMIAAALQRT
jgi:hypothetical protein